MSAIKKVEDSLIISDHSCPPPINASSVHLLHHKLINNTPLIFYFCSFLASRTASHLCPMGRWLQLLAFDPLLTHLNPLDVSGKWVKSNRTIYIGLCRGSWVKAGPFSTLLILESSALLDLPGPKLSCVVIPDQAMQNEFPLPFSAISLDFEQQILYF